MKQVAEVAYASQNSIDLYMQSLGSGPGTGRREPGFLGYLRRLPKLVWTLPTRHRIANQIRELKIRACEVGERRIRYDVRVPDNSHRNRANVSKAGWQAAGNDDTNGQEDAQRRFLADNPSSLFSRGEDRLIPFLTGVGEYHGRGGRRSLKVIAVVGIGRDGSYDAARAYQDPFVESSFDCRAWICLGQESTEAVTFLKKILAALDSPSDQPKENEEFILQRPRKEKEELVAQPQPKEKEELLAQPQPKEEEELLAQPQPTEEEELIAQLQPKEKVELISQPQPKEKEEFIAQPQPKENEELITQLQPKENEELITQRQQNEEEELTGKLQPNEEEELTRQLQLRLKGKRFFLVIDDARDRSLWNRIKSAFCHKNCSPDSAILITTRSVDVAQSFFPTCSIDLHTDSPWYLDSAMCLMNINNRSELGLIIWEIVTKPFAVRLFLRALYVNPNKTQADLQSLCDNLDNSTKASSNNARQVLKFCNLTSNCKNCLLYMSIFPEDTIFERKRLVRRWAVEGMTGKRGIRSALDEADHCFDLLVAHGFLEPFGESDTGKVKRCKVPSDVLEIVTQIAREDHFVKNNHHPELAHRLSVHYEGQPHKAEKELNVTRSQACWNICGHFNRSYQTTVEQSNATDFFLESLPSSTHSWILKVLDLEKCIELKDHHLENICKIFHLKYLSLRETGITELPKQLDKLQFLETLDIRETKVKAFANNSVFLPKLKHLLAGHPTYGTVAMPKHIGDMTELQVISHIAVSGDGSELKYVGYLVQLVKLGVAVYENKTSVLSHLYHATGNLGFLRSLSIEVIEIDEEENEIRNNKDASPIYPKHLHKLNISGLKNGLPSWIEKLKVLTKMTLQMTFITDDDFKILSQLTSLSWLRLQQESCNESTLTFKKDAFQCLKFLDIKCSAITSINFDNEACPKLKKLAWHSTGEHSLSGIEYLPSLEMLELLGSFDLESVQQAIEANRNKPRLLGYPRFRR